jgi:hypothetical protein
MVIISMVMEIPIINIGMAKSIDIISRDTEMPYNYRPKYGGRITSNFNKDYNGRDKGDKKNLEHTYKHGNKKHKNSKANEENYKEELIEKDWFR